MLILQKKQFGSVNLTSSPHYFEDNDVRSTQTRARARTHTRTHTQHATCSTWQIIDLKGRDIGCHPFYIVTVIHV